MSRDPLSRNFDRHEFACHGEDCCGHSAPISRELIAALQLLRGRIDRPMHIESGYRCITHNRSIGSRDTSQHVLGLAADVHTPEGLTVDEFYAEANGIQELSGIGRYSWGLHLDVRNAIHSRWCVE